MFILCMAGPLAAGFVSGIATAHNIDTWYAQLVKPWIQPPAWIFGPVWTVLYLVMGISLFLIWRSERGPFRSRGLLLFCIQIVLNFAWSFIFFQFRQPGWAFTEIILLWITLAAMIAVFYRVSKTAAWLQVPYLLWVSFATVLNGSIWWLN
jgi:benzodiazapine receptor